MKLLILLAVAGLSNSAKLDNTYLPPENAPAAGGSENFLQTPISGSPNEYQRNTGFGQRGSTRNNANNLARNGNNFVANGNNFDASVNKFAQNGQVSLGQNTVAQANNFSPTVNGFEAQNNYAQSANAFTQDTGAFVQPNYAQNDNFAQSVSFESRPERPRAALERNAAILRQDTQNNGETYAYAFETENGITAEENGVATNGVEAQGGFSYVGDDGQIYSIRYTADQNGFIPQGDHLPTPPPVPAEILKALEDNARDEANGIFDDGSYNAAKYGDNNFAGYNENANVGNFASNIGNNNQVFNGINQGFNDASKGDQGYNSVSNVNQGSNGVDNSNQAFNTGVSTGINYNNNAAEDETVITDNAQLRTQGAQTLYNENQGLRSQGSNLAQRNQAGFNQGGLDNQANFGQRNQFVGNQRQSNQLPRFGQENQGSRNQGLARSGSRAYLPPVQRSNGESARRQSYDPRTGYQY